MKEKVDHIESACPKCVTGSVKECCDTENLVKEKLLRLCRFDDCLREILSLKDADVDIATKLTQVFSLATNALIPTVLCVSCKGLTVKSPCENCGATLV